MAETPHLKLPYLAPAQAQKDVTVNEALARLDGMAQIVLASRQVTAPPVAAAEGAAYSLPAGAVNEWAGEDGKIALRVNGGWVFVPPARGWRAWIDDESVWCLHDGSAWRAGAVALSPSGAASYMRVTEFDHAVAAGPSSTTTGMIGAGEMVFAVTARVLADLTGTASGWSLGTAGAPDRFGSGLGLAAGSYARGMLGQPMTFWSAEPLVLTATGGDFAGGSVRLAIHGFDLALPGL